MKIFLFFTILSLFLSCKSRNASNLEGLDVDHSNIGSDDLMNKKIEHVTFLPNTLVPKGLVVTLHQRNFSFAVALYQIIHDINRLENLSGLEGPNQEITLVAVTQYAGLVEALKRDARENLSLTPEQEVPYLQKIVAKVADDLWMQDWGEFALAKVDGVANPVHAVIDTGRGIGSSPDVKFFSEIFKTPFIRLTDQDYKKVGSGNYGGNLEATNNRVLYYGDTLEDNGLLQNLLRLGNQNAIKLPATWLRVGHVDEYLSIIPAKNECHAALVVASPLEALNMLSEASPQDLEDTHVLNQTFLVESLQYFLKNKSARKPYQLADFDTNKPERKDFEGDRFVRGNLIFEGIIQEAIKTLTNPSSVPCLKDMITVPHPFNVMPNSMQGYATLGSTLNMLVLRNHLIIPEPHVANYASPVVIFKKAIIEKLAPVIGGPDKIHFIDTTEYHDGLGEIHCGTNVVRDPLYDVIIE